jgi:signal transduction histidine kinase
VIMTVTDDRRGFDPAIATAGFGLKSMRERVEAHGGKLEIASSSDGTQITARMPM